MAITHLTMGERSSYEFSFLRFEFSGFRRYLVLFGVFIGILGFSGLEIKKPEGNMGITHLMNGERRSYDQQFLKYGNFVTDALSGVIWRFYRKRVLMSNFTRQIRNQDHQIDQKKFVSLITSDVDTYLTLPLVYYGENMNAGKMCFECPNILIKGFNLMMSTGEGGRNKSKDKIDYSKLSGKKTKDVSLKFREKKYDDCDSLDLSNQSCKSFISLIEKLVIKVDCLQSEIKSMNKVLRFQNPLLTNMLMYVLVQWKRSSTFGILGGKARQRLPVQL